MNPHPLKTQPRPLTCLAAIKRPLFGMTLALASALAPAAPSSYWKLELLHSFDDGPGGRSPNGGLVESPAGVFWGTTAYGGADDGNGTVFKFTVGSGLQVMHTFHEENTLGARPAAGLLAVDSGSMFYGTTAEGGDEDMGTVFRISSQGQFAMMHAMTGLDGHAPNAPLTLGADGQFYGSNLFGGASGLGTLFRMNSSGAFSVLHAFKPMRQGNDGANPQSRLVQHRNGFLYGSTLGGAFSNGSLYKIHPSGAFTVLHSFQGLLNANGCEPRTGLTVGSDGDLVGTNTWCGSLNDGTLFTLTPEGSVSLMHTFDALPQGSQPDGELIQRADGRFYGSASGGADGCGSLFSQGVGPRGSFKRLAVFPADRSKGCRPVGALTNAADGALYGITEIGGAFDKGALFRLRKVNNLPAE